MYSSVFTAVTLLNGSPSHTNTCNIHTNTVDISTVPVHSIPATCVLVPPYLHQYINIECIDCTRLYCHTSTLEVATYVSYQLMSRVTHDSLLLLVLLWLTHAHPPPPRITSCSNIEVHVTPQLTWKARTRNPACYAVQTQLLCFRQIGGGFLFEKHATYFYGIWCMCMCMCMCT